MKRRNVYLLSLGMKNILNTIQKISNVWSPSNNRCSCGYLNSLQPLFIEAIQCFLQYAVCYFKLQSIGTKNSKRCINEKRACNSYETIKTFPTRKNCFSYHIISTVLYSYINIEWNQNVLFVLHKQFLGYDTFFLLFS